MHFSDITKNTCSCPESRSQVLLLQPQLGGYSEQRRYVRNTVGTSPSFFLLELKLVCGYIKQILPSNLGQY